MLSLSLGLATETDTATSPPATAAELSFAVYLIKLVLSGGVQEEGEALDCDVCAGISELAALSGSLLRSEGLHSVDFNLVILHICIPLTTSCPQEGVFVSRRTTAASLLLLSCSCRARELNPMQNPRPIFHRRFQL